MKNKKPKLGISIKKILKKKLKKEIKV